MLKIDQIDDFNIRIRQNSIDVNVAAIFFASVGESGMITISPKVSGAYRSFSDLLENVEINGVSGSSYTPETAVQELNSFVGNFKMGGSSSENNGGSSAPVRILGNIERDENGVPTKFGEIASIKKGRLSLRLFLDDNGNGTYTIYADAQLDNVSNTGLAGVYITSSYDSDSDRFVSTTELIRLQDIYPIVFCYLDNINTFSCQFDGHFIDYYELDSSSIYKILVRYKYYFFWLEIE